MKKGLIIFTLGLLLIGSVYSMSIDYFYSPNCGHCQKINPLIKNTIYKYSNIEWNLFDVSQGSYNIQGTPTIKIKTNDCRDIYLVGSYEIPKYIECEINEMSTSECPTTIELNEETNSYFIRD